MTPRSKRALSRAFERDMAELRHSIPEFLAARDRARAKTPGFIFFTPLQDAVPRDRSARRSVPYNIERRPRPCNAAPQEFFSGVYQASRVLGEADIFSPVCQVVGAESCEDLVELGKGSEEHVGASSSDAVSSHAPASTTSWPPSDDVGSVQTAILYPITMVPSAVSPQVRVVFCLMILSLIFDSVRFRNRIH